MGKRQKESLETRWFQGFSMAEKEGFELFTGFVNACYSALNSPKSCAAYADLSQLLCIMRYYLLSLKGKNKGKHETLYVVSQKVLTYKILCHDLLTSGCKRANIK